MSEPIRIAFGITDLDVGGAERTLVELVTRLDGRRWSPSVVCLQPAGPLADGLRERGIDVTSLDLRSAAGVPMALPRWTRLLRRARPRLLQTFLFHANLLGRLAGRLAGVPHAVGGIRVAERRARWPLWLDRCTHRLACRHVCVSSDVRDFAAKEIGIPRRRLEVIPNGVDLDRADAASPADLSEYGIGPKAIVLLFLGRLDPQKGLPDLIEALRILNDRNPLAGRLAVPLVGAGPLHDELRNDVRRRGLETIVRFAGWRPNPWDWLAAADGLILPSHWEGMPNVVLEAMASRRPVIATAVEGTGELVQPGRTGWLVPARSPADLADAIEAFLERPQDHHRLGGAGRALAEEYSYPKMVARYETLYEELMADG